MSCCVYCGRSLITAIWSGSGGGRGRAQGWRNALRRWQAMWDTELAYDDSGPVDRIDGISFAGVPRHQLVLIPTTRRAFPGTDLDHHTSALAFSRGLRRLRQNRAAEAEEGEAEDAEEEGAAEAWAKEREEQAARDAGLSYMRWGEV
eukprot:3410036-Rhodomonas_salina.4